MLALNLVKMVKFFELQIFRPSLFHSIKIAEKNSFKNNYLSLPNAGSSHHVL